MHLPVLRVAITILPFGGQLYFSSTPIIFPKRDDNAFFCESHHDHHCPRNPAYQFELNLHSHNHFFWPVVSTIQIHSSTFIFLFSRKFCHHRHSTLISCLFLLLPKRAYSSNGLNKTLLLCMFLRNSKQHPYHRDLKNIEH